MLELTDTLQAVEELMEALARGETSERTGEIVVEHLATGGKRLRARLALAAHVALGGAATKAVPWAAASELLHNATLVHDDLQDGDRLRRGRPTTWVAHGMAHAINAGDLMFMLPFLAVGKLEVSGELRARMCEVVASRAADVIRGQVAEYEMNRRGTAAWDEYMKAIEGKTSALFCMPVEGAALLAGRDADRARELAEPFRALGVLFQLQDDVLDLWGEKGRDARGADLYEGKVSALVVEHLALHPQDRAWLVGLLRLERDATPRDEVERAIERFERGGARARVIERIRVEAEAARRAVARTGEDALAALVVELTAKLQEPIQHVVG